MHQRMVVRQRISHHKNHLSSRRVVLRAPIMHIRLITSLNLASKMRQVLMRVVIPRQQQFHRQITTRQRRFRNLTRRTLVNLLLLHQCPRLLVTTSPPLAVRYNYLSLSY